VASGEHVSQIETNFQESFVEMLNPLYDDISDDYQNVDQNISNLDSTIPVEDIDSLRIHAYHPTENILGDLNAGVQTRNQVQNQESLFSCFLSQLEPKNIKMALQDYSWVEAMQEELQQFKKMQVWELVKLPQHVHPIGTRWVFRVKRDDRGVVIRNKAKLVVQGFT
ncbi:MAG TPA: reverse transcriptase domain-containing protein, partial [Rhabdochlamydiaceae bacterium]